MEPDEIARLLALLLKRKYQPRRSQTRIHASTSYHAVPLINIAQVSRALASMEQQNQLVLVQTPINTANPNVSNRNRRRRQRKRKNSPFSM